MPYITKILYLFGVTYCKQDWKGFQSNKTELLQLNYRYLIYLPDKFY